MAIKIFYKKEMLVYYNTRKIYHPNKNSTISGSWYNFQNITDRLLMALTNILQS